MRTRHIIIGIVLLFCAGNAGAANVETQRRHVYIVPFSHLDLWWAGTKEECLSRGNRIINKALQIARDNPEFRFLIESNVFLANYEETHRGTRELEELRSLIKQGKIEISPMWSAIMVDLPDGEIIARNFLLGRGYARKTFGVDPQTASFADIPAFPPQMPQILRLSDTPFAVISRMGPPQAPLFDWVAPNGSVARTWFSPDAYNWGTALGLHEELNPQRLAVTGAQVQMRAESTPAPIFMHWGMDLYAPAPSLPANVRPLNAHFEKQYSFKLSTQDEYFESAGNMKELPRLSGEIPSAWPNITSAIANLWPKVTPATSVLRTAETFATVNYALGFADYPRAKLDFLWQKLIEASDHNQNGQGGWIGDRRKEEYTEIVSLGAGEILRESLRNIAERVAFPEPQSAAVVVFNPNAWRRTDLVKTHVTVFGDVNSFQVDAYRKGVRLVDENGTPVPFTIERYSENISRAYDISFVARDVPSVGYKTYYLQPAPEVSTSPAAVSLLLDKEKDAVDPRRPQGSDVAENDFYRLEIDRTTGGLTIFDKELSVNVVKDMHIVGVEERGGDYVVSEPLSGRVIPRVVDGIEVEANDAVSARLLVKGHVAGVDVAQRITLFKALKRIDLENTVIWTKPRFIRLEQLIPIQNSEAKVQYGVPFGSNDRFNLLPGSGPRRKNEINKSTWLASRMIHDWIAASGPDWTLTVAADHAFVRIENEVVHAQMLRGTKNSSVRIISKEGAGSMQYPQPGTYTFNYSLVSGKGDWLANKSYRFGRDFNNAFIAVSSTDELRHKPLPSSKSFLAFGNDSVVLSSLKKRDDAEGIVARIYEVEGRTSKPGLSFNGKDTRAAILNIMEEPIEGNADTVLPFEIKSLGFEK